MVINTIDDALAWVNKNARNIGSGYLCRDERIERVLGSFNGYVEALKEHPDQSPIYGQIMIGAINAYEALATADDIKRISLEALRDGLHKSKEAADG
jgi:hypothetical protein